MACDFHDFTNDELEFAQQIYENYCIFEDEDGLINYNNPHKCNDFVCPYYELCNKFVWKARQTIAMLGECDNIEAELRRREEPEEDDGEMLESLLQYVKDNKAKFIVFERKTTVEEFVDAIAKSNLRDRPIRFITAYNGEELEEIRMSDPCVAYTINNDGVVLLAIY